MCTTSALVGALMRQNSGLAVMKRQTLYERLFGELCSALSRK
jgi:hypothetical protein